MRNRLAIGERGMALPIVLIMTVCLLFIGSGLFMLLDARLHLNNNYITKNDVVYAAETGLNRFLWELNNDPALDDPANLQNYLNQGFSGSIQTASWTNQVTGKSENEIWDYYVTVTNSNTGGAAPNELQLACTAWLASDPTRQYSVRAVVSKRQYCQYLYFTNNETDEESNPAYWGPGDVLHGSLFTNDVIQDKYSSTPPADFPVGYPIFYGPVSYAAAVTGRSNCTITTPQADWQQEFQGNTNPPDETQQQYYPFKISQLNWPANNSGLIYFAQSPQGYYFQGRTCIDLQGGEFYYDCQGKAWGLNHAWGTGTPLSSGAGRHGPYPLPANGVIYVDNYNSEVDTNLQVTPSNPTGSIYGSNYKNEDTEKFDPGLGNVFVSGTLDGELTIAAGNNIYLTAGDPTGPAPALTAVSQNGYNLSVNDNSDLVTYANTSFNQSASNNNLYGTVSGDDMLGLMANNYVTIMRWGWPTDGSSWASNPSSYAGGLTGGAVYGTTPDYSPANSVSIDAAIMAINHDFCFEDADWDFNTLSPASVPYTQAINLTGALMQNFRGSISGGDILDESNNFCLGDGYLKNYWFDPRMSYESPPHWLQPSNAGWGILNWSLPLPSATQDVFTPWQSVSITASGSPVPSAIPVGGSQQLNASITPPNVLNQTVTWSLLSNEVNTAIDQGGILSSISGSGSPTGTVYVTVSDATGTSTVTDQIPVTIMGINPNNISVTSGGGGPGTYQATVTVEVDPGNVFPSQTGSWVPSDGSIAAESGPIFNSGACTYTCTVATDSPETVQTVLTLTLNDTANTTVTFAPISVTTS
jgi:hypothetical protein